MQLFQELLVEVATKTFFVDFHEIAVPPYKNTNPVYDLAL